MNLIALELLKIALENDAQAWSFSGPYCITAKDAEGLATRYWVDIDSNGERWVYFREYHPEGQTQTGVGRLCQI